MENNPVISIVTYNSVRDQRNALRSELDEAMKLLTERKEEIRELIAIIDALKRALKAIL